jgi:putative peptide zinc metalloprotease protein
MKDGAYAGHQYLVEREGQFIQLTELLFLTLAHVDGKRGVEEIAKLVSAKAFRVVTPENIRDLLAKLVPLGLVAAADGSFAPTQREAAAASPMQIQMKMAVLPPPIVNAVTGLFRVFFLPPVVVAVLIASVLAHAWLYLVHGVGRSVHDILYQPGLILLLLAAFILSAAFHELGHGAGLRYGGGTVRAMGVGLYLIYPVFYTDITDSYRLARGPKLRTSLGGFYFNLIFSLAALALFAASGAEFLLLAMALIDLEIVYQMLPFVRMDGYWILADLTGIPDFFSRMGAFVRGLFGQKQAEMAELKPWAKVVFVLYTIIVIPLLALLLFLAFRAFPTVLATALDSASKLASAAGGGLARGDGIAVVAAVVQILILALQVVGLGMIIVGVIKALFLGLWRWGAASGARRAASTFASAALLLGLAFLWTPVLPTGQPGPLYAATVSGFTPIPDTARGTLGDAFAAVGALVPTEPVPSEEPSVAPSPASSPTATPTASPSATPRPSPTPTVTPLPTATP